MLFFIAMSVSMEGEKGSERRMKSLLSLLLCCVDRLLVGERDGSIDGYSTILLRCKNAEPEEEKAELWQRCAASYAFVCGSCFFCLRVT